MSYPSAPDDRRAHIQQRYQGHHHHHHHAPPSPPLHHSAQHHPSKQRPHHQSHHDASHSLEYAPHEPTPPDSGRSKTIREYDLSRLDQQQQQEQHEREVEYYRHAGRAAREPSSAGSECTLTRREAAVSGQDEHCEEEEEDDDDDDEVGKTATKPLPFDWQSEDDGDDGQFRAPYSAAPSHRASHMERSSSSSSRASSEASYASTSYASPPRHGGDVRCQVPIRDTPNNPFLQSYRGYRDSQDDQRGRRRTGRGEDAARVQQNGYLACVFRGQRILQLDVASDDSDDEDLFGQGGGPAPRGRLQPKLLFPEAHALEARRQRQRQLEEQARQRDQRIEMSRLRLSSQGPLSRMTRPSMSSMPSSSSLSLSRTTSRTAAPPPTRGNLFAAQLRQQAHQRELNGQHASLEVRPRQFNRTKSSRQVEELSGHDLLSTSGNTRADPRLLATLERAGWDSDDMDGDECDDGYSDSEEFDYAQDGQHEPTVGPDHPYAPYEYRPPVPEDYDRARAVEQAAADDDEEAFWMGGGGGGGPSRPVKPLRRSNTTTMDGGRGVVSTLSRSHSHSHSQVYAGGNATRRPALMTRMAIHSTNKRAWDESFREPAGARESGVLHRGHVVESSSDEAQRSHGTNTDRETDSDDPFSSRPVARRSRTSMHNGLPICALPSRSGSSTALPTGASSTSLSSHSQSANPFDLHFLAGIRE